MNMTPPFALSRFATAEPVRILVIGTREGIQETIDTLCTTHFCDHTAWSKIQPKPDRPGEFFSIMTRWRI